MPTRDTDAGDDTAMAAYWRFFESFNSRDAAHFSAALHYPHVRLAPKPTPVLVPTAQAHAAAMSWEQVIASGWDHTEGHEPKLLHTAADRAHIVGGWTRLDADGEPVGRNRVVYIATRVDGRWGIQSRFATPGGTAASAENAATTRPPPPQHAGTTRPPPPQHAGHQRALAMVEEYIDAYNDRHWSRCVNLLATPHFQVDVGMVREWSDGDTLWRALRDGPWHFVTVLDTAVVQGGDDSVVVAFEGALDGGDTAVKGVFYAMRRDDAWGIQARSIFAA